MSLTERLASAETRRNAMSLTAAFLRRDDDLGTQLARLGMPEILNVTVHLLHALANVMEGETGSREAAIASLQKQIEESDAIVARATQADAR